MDFDEVRVNKPSVQFHYQFKNQLKVAGQEGNMLPSKHILSEHESMIGSVDHVAYKSHLINSNFHARLLHVMDPELKFSEKLENFFNARIEAHKLEK